MERGLRKLGFRRRRRPRRPALHRLRLIPPSPCTEPRCPPRTGSCALQRHTAAPYEEVAALDPARLCPVEALCQARRPALGQCCFRGYRLATRATPTTTQVCSFLHSASSEQSAPYVSHQHLLRNPLIFEIVFCVLDFRLIFVRKQLLIFCDSLGN
jgi:hypothetical protein